MRRYTFKINLTHKNRRFEHLPEEVVFASATPDEARQYFWTNLEALIDQTGLELYCLDEIFITSVSSEPIKE